MTFEKAIMDCYGIQFSQIPCDGKMRRFAIGKDQGFAILLEDCGSFGNWSRNELFEWDGSKVRQISNGYVPPKISRYQINRENDIITAAISIIDAGGALNDDDLDRYILALQRVIEAKQ